VSGSSSIIASRWSSSTRITSVPGSADLCDAMQASSLPRSLSDGPSHDVHSSTSGRFRAISRTVSNVDPAGRRGMTHCRPVIR
jgi:hypothetical protein